MYAKDGPVSLEMRLPVDSSGAYIEYTYTLHPDRYLMDVNLRMKGMEEHRTDNVQLNWMFKSPQQEQETGKTNRIIQACITGISRAMWRNLSSGRRKNSRM